MASGSQPLHPKELKRTAELLFEGDPQLVRLPGFLEGYLAAVAAHGSRNVLLRLVSTYCIHFDPIHPAIRDIATFIVSSVTHLPTVWAERHHAVAS